MDYEAASSELIRALRGRRSQGAVNRRLGRSSNAAHAWEHGTRQPRASDFFKLARVAGVPVDRVLGDLASGAPPVTGGLAAWLELLARGASHAELSRALGRDRNTVARWLAGTSEPRLPDLLRWVEHCTQRLLDFVAAFADPESLPSLSAAWRDLDRQRRVAYELPWAHAVLRVLELEEYRKLDEHVPGFIAQRIGISEALETECLRALAEAGQVRRQQGKWRVRRVLSVDTREDPTRNVELKRHWARVAVERIDAAGLPPLSQYSYNLFAISDEGLEQIRQAHLQYYERVRAIVAECEHPTRLALVNVQLLPLDAP